jgi:hypothetical protein
MTESAEENNMKLTGNLKKQVENEGTEGRKKLIEKAGMKLTDDEIEKVTGGGAPRSGPGDGTGQDGEDHQFDKGVYWDTLD